MLYLRALGYLQLVSSHISSLTLYTCQEPLSVVRREILKNAQLAKHVKPSVAMSGCLSFHHHIEPKYRNDHMMAHESHVIMLKRSHDATVHPPPTPAGPPYSSLSVSVLLAERKGYRKISIPTYMYVWSPAQNRAQDYTLPNF